MKPYPFALSPFLTFKTFLALNSLICRHLANKCSDRFPESAVSVKRTTPTVVSKSMPRSAQILSGMIIVASCVVVPLPAAAKECSRVKVEGLGSDPSEEGPFTQAARERARARAINDWERKVSLDPKGYHPHWSHGHDGWTPCQYNNEAQFAPAGSNEIRCRAVAFPCRLSAKPPTPRPYKPKAKCPPTDFRCKAATFKHLPRFKVGPPGVKKKIFLQPVK